MPQKKTKIAEKHKKSNIGVLEKKKSVEHALFLRPFGRSKAHQNLSKINRKNDSARNVLSQC